MNDLELVHLINQLWVGCLTRDGKPLPDGCPTDEDVMNTIKEYLKRKRKQKQENEHDEA